MPAIQLKTTIGITERQRRGPACSLWFRPSTGWQPSTVLLLSGLEDQKRSEMNSRPAVLGASGLLLGLDWMEQAVGRPQGR